ncbi:hypothetical protein CRJUMX01_850002 [Escherichia coli]|nr:hypothetical protein CRJUMX01_850002 [Escherichia coli]
MLFSHLLKHLLKNNDLIHQDNNLLLGVRLRSVHDRFYHFNLVCPLAVICTKCERGITCILPVGILQRTSSATNAVVGSDYNILSKGRDKGEFRGHER